MRLSFAHADRRSVVCSESLKQRTAKRHRKPNRPNRHSGWIPAALIQAPHFTSSAFTNDPNSSGMWEKDEPRAILDQIGKVLQTRQKEAEREPLPKLWV